MAGQQAIREDGTALIALRIRTWHNHPGFRSGSPWQVHAQHDHDGHKSDFLWSDGPCAAPLADGISMRQTSIAYGKHRPWPRSGVQSSKYNTATEHLTKECLYRTFSEHVALQSSQVRQSVMSLGSHHCWVCNEEIIMSSSNLKRSSRSAWPSTVTCMHPYGDEVALVRPA